MAETTDEAAKRVAAAAEHAGTRIAKTASKAADSANDLGHRATAPLRARNALMLRAQLARTSHELANETADMGLAVDALNEVIRKSRKAGAKGRTRLFVGLVAGAALMYHLDPEHGRRRRSAITSAVKGSNQPPLD